MHRIARLGDVQESNKHERHHAAPAERARFGPWAGPSSQPPHAKPDSDAYDEQRAALLDLGRLFEACVKAVVVTPLTAAWQSVAGLYHVTARNDFEALHDVAWELGMGSPE